MASNIPSVLSDVLLHVKTDNQEEVVIMPITRYDNVVSAPNVVTSNINHEGAPFHLLKTGSVELPVEELRKICGNIF